MNSEKIVNFLKSLAEPAKVKKMTKAFYVILALVVVSDFLVHREHAAFPWDHVPGFSALYGLVSSIVIILVSKAIGHAILMKKEDYYD